MVTATFHIHDALQHFLPPQRRGRAFAARCAEHATVKHMLEALGIPHTELGEVRVNAAAAALERELADGDVVQAGAAPPLSAPPSPARFIADAHLGGLARFLRMAGIDTLYENGYADDEIEAIAAGEARIVLTRDRELLKRSGVARGRYVRAIRPESQLQEIFAHYALAQAVHPFSLCLRCNVPLLAVQRDAVLAQLPPSVAATHTQFQRCPSCGGVFWPGSHWRRMREVIRRVAPAAFSQIEGS